MGGIRMRRKMGEDLQLLVYLIEGKTALYVACAPGENTPALRRAWGIGGFLDDMAGMRGILNYLDYVKFLP